MTEPVPEAEAYIQFRLSELAARNEHHRFEEICTRIARKRISSNILIATGPVSSGGDQGRDGETFATRIPDELPHSAGFSATASASPIVIACTIQSGSLRAKVVSDLAAICEDDASPVSHVAYFSVHGISEGVTHELQRLARETYGITLDIFCGADIAVFLAEPDLVWVARHYLDLPTTMVPPPEGEPSPEWYGDLLESLRRNNGPAALTFATQGEVTRGLRFATYDPDARSDLPEWIDFMGAFLTDSDSGVDTELVFHACYEMAVATFRGTGRGASAEELTRRAVAHALTSDQSTVVEDAVTLVSYWGGTWAMGAARAEVAEIVGARDALRKHAGALLNATDESTHPVRTASLVGTLAFLHLTPDWQALEDLRGRPSPVEVAPTAGIPMDDIDIDVSSLERGDLDDARAAMDYLERLVDVLPRARAFSIDQLAQIFALFTPVLSDYPNYEKVRDGLDAAVASVEGDSALAHRCRDRAIAFRRVGQPLKALRELHKAKVNWFNGETLYGTVLTMRFIGEAYGELGLSIAAKMYVFAAAAVAISHGDGETKEQFPQALLEAARHAQHVGQWADGAAITEVALLARLEFMADPFNFDLHPDLLGHRSSSAMEVTAIRQYWPELEHLIADAYPRTGWFEVLTDLVEGAQATYQLTEDEYQRKAAEQLNGPVFSDLGPERLVDFEALGVRWKFTFANDRETVLAAEGLIAAFQVFLADLAPYEPVIIESTVNVRIKRLPGADHRVDNARIDDSEPTIKIDLNLSSDVPIGDLGPYLIGLCFQLIDVVHARPVADLKAILEPMFKDGLPHKVFAGRPYEELADYMDDEFYETCAAAHRPTSSGTFAPSVNPALLPSSASGVGYDQLEAVETIAGRYEVAYDVLRFTLPRILSDANRREALLKMRDDGRLDWQILMVLLNIVVNWRMANDGVDLHRLDFDEMVKRMHEPETEAMPTIPLEAFGDAELRLHSRTQATVVAQRWQLQGRQVEDDEDPMRELLTRRYRFAVDDVAHRDLFDCLDSDGKLLPFVR